jgi:two-component system chemotaxis sensor kinase CheA
MDEMKETYVQEANELLENLESSLLSLEDNPNDKSNIEQVFRVMHTLKGNSSMFGLTKIAEFVHDLETIYDKIRQNEMQLSKEILNTTLASFDHLNKIIYDSELEDQNNKDTHFRLIAEIHVFIGKSGGGSSANSNTDGDHVPQAINSESVSDDSNSLKTFHIYFEPNPSIFLDGSNPLYLIAELAAMGKSIVVPHFKTVTNLDEYSPTDCITYWDVYLESTCLKTDVLDVFVFVEGNSTIEIMEMPFINLISNNAFNEVVIASTFKDLKTDTTSIRLLAESIGTKVETTSKQSKLSKALAAEAEAGSGVVSKEKVVSSIRVASDKLDELMNLVSELVTTQASLTLYNEKNETPELEVITENIEKLSRRLRDIAFGMTLVPINNMFSRFQRLVRDMSETLGKEIQFVTEGGETELDKSIIETLTDPLMHIIRNSLDHGLEKAEDRMLLDKPRKGTVKLKAFYSGISVYVQIIDDGKGIDVEAVRAKAISKGFITEGDVLTDKEIFDYIFYPGFSTAAVVTDISGRGVGMDVVKRNITDLKGSIVVESTVNVGTTLTIKLPLSLSIIDGLLVDIEGVNYIIPLSVVNKCYEVDNSEMLNNFNKLLVLDEKQVPFIDIRNEFGYKKLDSTAKSQLIVVSDGDQQVGITVDYIVGEYQAVVKPIGKYYKNQDFISGATILGDGSIALVMDTHKIVELYTDHFKLESK